MKFFDNMDGEDKLVAILIMAGAFITIVYIITSAFAGK